MQQQNKAAFHSKTIFLKKILNRLVREKSIRKKTKKYKKTT